MARLRKSRAEMEKWYIRGIPVAFIVGGIGAVMGLILNIVFSVNGYEVNLIPFFAVGAFAGAFLVLGVVELSGSAASRLYGGSPFTAAVDDYSYPDSLAARGLYDAAVAAYRNAAEENPTAAEPLLRAARVMRDALRRYPEAIELLREARSRGDGNEGLEELVAREITEIYATKLGEPARALPELARLLDRYPDSPAAEWARRRMAELRRQAWETVKGPEDGDGPQVPGGAGGAGNAAPA